MTIRTGIRTVLEKHHFLVLRPMRPVTAQTSHGQVSVPLVYEFRTEGMHVMGLPVMTLPANIYHRHLAEQGGLIGRMRRMAGRAGPLLHRRMLGFSLLHLCHRIGMALTADHHHGFFQKPFLVRCMRAVAIQTTCLVEQRPVDPVLGEELVDLWTVAFPAQLETRLLQFQGVRRRRQGVALIAHLLGKGAVHPVVKQSLLVGTVRIVADRTLCPCHWIPHVHILEDGLLRIMTLQAETGHLIFELLHRCTGGVGAVAIDTAALHWRVLEFSFRHALAHLLVAFKAEGVSRLQEIKLVFCPMGIMTLDALPFGDRLVCTDRLFRKNPRMALQTNLLDLGGKKFLVTGGVGIVAARAVARPYRGMDIRILQFFLEQHMAVQTVFPPGIGFEFELVRALCRRERQKHSDNRNR